MQVRSLKNRFKPILFKFNLSIFSSRFETFSNHLTKVAGILPTPHRTAKDFVEGDEGQRKWGISGKKKEWRGEAELDECDLNCA